MIFQNQMQKEVYEARQEIAARIAAAQRSNDDACTTLPPREWSPTIGQPEASNSVLSKEPCTAPMPPVKTTLGARPDKFAPKWDYETLWDILADAYDHAATGKGKERHARDLPFDKQPMLETTRLVGPGFPLGQAIKKAGEAAGMIERGELEAAEAECLGAINYLAGAVAWVRERAQEGRVAA